MPLRSANLFNVGTVAAHRKMKVAMLKTVNMANNLEAIALAYLWCVDSVA